MGGYRWKFIVKQGRIILGCSQPPGDVRLISLHLFDDKILKVGGWGSTLHTYIIYIYICIFNRFFRSNSPVSRSDFSSRRKREKVRFRGYDPTTRNTLVNPRVFRHETFFSNWDKWDETPFDSRRIRDCRSLFEKKYSSFFFSLRGRKINRESLTVSNRRF